MMQAGPSLAFGFLIRPFIGGIGPHRDRGAGLLLIIHGCYGILGVDRNVREAAVAME